MNAQPKHSKLSVIKVDNIKGDIARDLSFDDDSSRFLFIQHKLRAQL